ncbi:MAG: IS200/IS605 family element transposase accessory protein TnpB [Candidatus Lokiarchaeota archaeon]|nr:IS200/IS605 family element transposase accessory protein TnpB [Candidatus Lokiarchaeota archaeon]MBD3338639.1 IS200/IS605 family element transposase accessory protein TnpB [Candidatus Lokiarchaeota archaeon]
MVETLQLTVIGKVFNPNWGKRLSLNKTLHEYFECVRWHLSFDSSSKSWLHKNAYEEAKQKFDLKTALIQSARDKAVEILKSFRKMKKKHSVLKLKRVSIRFDSRSYSFAKTDNELTAYWLSLSLEGRGRTSFPIVFGERENIVEKVFDGKATLRSVELRKREGIWYAHFNLEKKVEVPDDPETVIGIDRGEKNFAVAVAIEKNAPHKPRKGQFWKGNEIKALKGKYSHLRRNLGRKKLPQLVSKIKDTLKKKTDHLLHVVANEIVAYASQFEKPIIAFEDLTDLRKNFGKTKKSKMLNRRMNSLPFRKLQTYVEYKALREGIKTAYVDPKHTSQECHRCGKRNKIKFARTYTCSCGLNYDRDLNASVNIAHRITSSMGWGKSGLPEQPNEVTVAKT